MRFIRLLGALVIFYGLSYLLHALMQSISVLPYPPLRTTHVILIGINLTIGIVTIINGVGLLLTRKWARIAWLVVVTLLLLFHDFVLLVTYMAGANLTQQLLNVALIFFLAVISWSKLPESSAKQYFV